MAYSSDVPSLLRAIFSLEDDVILSQSHIWQDLRSQGLRLAQSELTPWERHANAAMLKRWMKDNTNDWPILEARYCPAVARLRLQKQQACADVAVRLHARGQLKFKMLVTQEWSGLKLRRRWLHEWVGQTGKSLRTLYRVRNEIRGELNYREEVAINQLTAAMALDGMLED